MARTDLKDDVITLVDTVTNLTVYDKPFQLVLKPVYPCACVVIGPSSRNIEIKDRYREEATVLIGLFLHPAKPNMSQQVEDLDDLIDDVLDVLATTAASGSLQIITEEDEPMVSVEPGWAVTDVEAGLLSWSAILSFNARQVVTT